MIRYVLDTDHLSLLQRGHANLQTRLESIPPQEIAITIITTEEQLRGRLAQIKKAPARLDELNAQHECQSG